MATDRQRTELRAKSSDVTALNGETVYYRWKFKLPVGFQETDFFTHIHQIKSNQADPILTLTPMSGQMFIGGRIGRHGSTDLSKFLGVWVVVESKVVYSNNGSLAMTIRRLSDGQVMLSYSGAVDMWDDGGGTHDAKFGFYRSLDGKSKLRDEQVRFADICVSKVSANECDDGLLPPIDAGADPDAGGARDAGAPVDASSDIADAGGGQRGGAGNDAAGGSTATSGAGGTSGSGGASGNGGASGSIGAGGDGHTGGTMPGGAGRSQSTGGEQDLTGGCACHAGARGPRWHEVALAAVLVSTLARRRRSRVKHPDAGTASSAQERVR
jgi:hypothetical protein